MATGAKRHLSRRSPAASSCCARPICGRCFRTSRVPTLVIAGQYDRVTMPAASHALADSLPDARYVEIRRAAHAPFLSHLPRAQRADLRLPAAAMTERHSPGSFQLDKAGVRAAFDRASATYEAAAVLQSRVADGAAQPPRALRLSPRGHSRSRCRHRPRSRGAQAPLPPRTGDRPRPRARHAARSRPPPSLFRRFERVCADAARLPLASRQRRHRLQQPHAAVVRSARRGLRRGAPRPQAQGFFAFTTFGPDTLQELRSAWAEADTHNHVNHFLDMHDVGDALVRAGLQEPVLDVDRTQLTYRDGMALMRDLKSIGARNATAGRPRSLVGRARLQRVLERLRVLPQRRQTARDLRDRLRRQPGAAPAGRRPRVHAGEVRISPCRHPPQKVKRR